MRYVYESLCVASPHFPKYFDIDQLPDAIAYLRSQPAPDLRLIARTYTTVGRYRLCAEPALTLDWLVGKTPAEIWAAFDAEVDRWAAGLESRYARMRPMDAHGDASSRSQY
jgi:hypothetical protein